MRFYVLRQQVAVLNHAVFHVDSYFQRLGVLGIAVVIARLRVVGDHGDKRRSVESSVSGSAQVDGGLPQVYPAHVQVSVEKLGPVYSQFNLR